MTDLNLVTRALRNPRVVVGAGQGMDATEALLLGAERSITLEAFRLIDDRIVGATSDRLAAGVKTHILGDPEEWNRWLSRDLLTEQGARFTRFGDLPNKLHSKLAVVDGERAVITTSAWVNQMRDGWIDLAVFFDGDAARAAEQLTHVSMAGDARAIQGAAREAAAQGVLLNDIANDVGELRGQVMGMIRGAGRGDELVVVTKRLEDPGVLKELKRARKRGADVTAMQRPKPWHANVVIANDQAYVGTAHLTKRSMVGGGSSGRLSREIGVLIDDPTSVDAVRSAALTV